MQRRRVDAALGFSPSAAICNGCHERLIAEMKLKLTQKQRSCKISGAVKKKNTPNSIFSTSNTKNTAATTSLSTSTSTAAASASRTNSDNATPADGTNKRDAEEDTLLPIQQRLAPIAGTGGRTSGGCASGGRASDGRASDGHASSSRGSTAGTSTSSTTNANDRGVADRVKAKREEEWSCVKISKMGCSHLKVTTSLCRAM